MIRDKHIGLVKKVEDVKQELDYNKASWVNKHKIIDLNDKSQVILKTFQVVSTKKEEKEAVLVANEFLKDVEPIIISLNKGEV